MENHNPLLQMPGESDFAYHRRLIYGKLCDRTLAEYDYAELSKYVYGEDLSADSVRKLMYGSKRTLELIDKDRSATAAPSVLKDIATQTRELRKESKKYFDQRREYYKLVDAEGRRDHIESILSESADRLGDTIGRVYPNADVYEYVQTVDDEAEAVLVFSDWHYGMIADNVFNHYDTQTCIDRVEHVVHETIKRIVLHKCSKLHVVVLGDLMHGGIHCGARVASEELVADQLMQAAEILAQSIEYLSKFVKQTFVYSTYGNHARTIQNKKDSIHRDNMERIIPWWLSQRLKCNTDIVIMPEEENEFLFIDACGHEFCAAHGDLDSVKSSPRLLATLFQKKYGMDIEYILIGDKHHRESFDEVGITAMICGSLCGTDDYANSKRLYSTPEQLLLIVNKEIGVDAEYRIKC